MINPIDTTESYFIKDQNILSVQQFDSSLLLGSTVLYEVIRVVDSSPVFYGLHMQRFMHSAKLSGLAFPDFDQITYQIKLLLKQNPIKEKNLRLALVYREGSDMPIFLAYFIKSSYPEKQLYEQGVRVELLNAMRDNPLVKAENHSLREVANGIIAAGAFEALLVNDSNEITEGSRSNFFAVKDVCVYTSPLGVVLEGITRKIVLQICKELNVCVIERSVLVSELDLFSSVFLTGTSPKVLPIAQIGDRKFEPQNRLVAQISEEFLKKEKESILEWLSASKSTL